jgi:hypothetical protein
MEKLDILSRLKSAFKSGNQDVIDHALEEIKSNGDDTYISPLVEYVHQNLPKENKERIFQLFDDLKHENSVDQLVCELKNEIDPDVLERLVASCWQNGLNYSKHLPFFVHLVMDQEFQIAFEAFTVIENMYGKIDRDVENELITAIEKRLSDSEERKKYLLKGMLDLIPNIPLDQDPVDY